MKKIMNTPESYVMDMCRGIALAHPELEFVEKYKIVKKKEINADKVTLISGGGSGHEPAHAGFVGTGMLDAAVCGDVFASPSQVQIYNALKLTASDKGTLMIIKNYSGDCMNFNGAGADATEDEGLNIERVFVKRVCKKCRKPIKKGRQHDENSSGQKKCFPGSHFIFQTEIPQFHPYRTPGNDCDHRHLSRNSDAGSEFRPQKSAKHQLHQQFENMRSADDFLCGCIRRLSACRRCVGTIPQRH